jgi:hypothetical protein
LLTLRQLEGVNGNMKARLFVSRNPECPHIMASLSHVTTGANVLTVKSSANTHSQRKLLPASNIANGPMMRQQLQTPPSMPAQFKLGWPQLSTATSLNIPKPSQTPLQDPAQRAAAAAAALLKSNHHMRQQT